MINNLSPNNISYKPVFESKQTKKQIPNIGLTPITKSSLTHLDGYYVSLAEYNPWQVRKSNQNQLEKRRLRKIAKMYENAVAVIVSFPTHNIKKCKAKCIEFF